jgi:hypothetical protein
MLKEEEEYTEHPACFSFAYHCVLESTIDKEIYSRCWCRFLFAYIARPQSGHDTSHIVEDHLVVESFVRTWEPLFGKGFVVLNSSPGLIIELLIIGRLALNKELTSFCDLLLERI